MEQAAAVAPAAAVVVPYVHVASATQLVAFVQRCLAGTSHCRAGSTAFNGDLNGIYAGSTCAGVRAHTVALVAVLLYAAQVMIVPHSEPLFWAAVFSIPIHRLKAAVKTETRKEDGQADGAALQNVRFLLWSPLGSALWIGVAGLGVWTVHHAASALITQTCGPQEHKVAPDSTPPISFPEQLKQWWKAQKAKLANIDRGLGGWFDIVFSVAHFYILSRVYMAKWFRPVWVVAVLGLVAVVGHLVLLITYYLAIFGLRTVLREGHPAVKLLLKVPTLPSKFRELVGRGHDFVSKGFSDYWARLRHQFGRAVGGAHQVKIRMPEPVSSFTSYVAAEVSSILPKVRSKPGEWLRMLGTSAIKFAAGFTTIIVIFVLGAAVVVGFVLLLSLAYQDVQTFLSKRGNDLRSGIGGYLQDPAYASALELARNKTVSSLWGYGDDLLQTFAPGANLTVAMVLATGQETATWLRCRFSHGDAASELDCSPWQSIRTLHTQTCLSNCDPDFATDDDRVRHRGTWWVVDEHLDFVPFTPAVNVCAPDGRQDLYTRRVSCAATCSYVDSCFQKQIIDDGDTNPVLLAEVLPRTVAVLRNGSWSELSYENVETMVTELGDLVRTALRRLTEVSNTTSDSHSPLVDNVVFIANSFKTIVWSQLTPYVVPIINSVVNTVMTTVAQAILFFSAFVFFVTSNRTVVRHAVNIIIGPRHLVLCDLAEKMLTQRVNGILVASMQKSVFYMLFTWTTCAIAGSDLAHVLTLVAGTTALFPSVLPTLLLASIPIIQLVVDHSYALAAVLIIVYLFVYLNIDGVVYAQGEDNNKSGSDAWLAFMGVFLGFQAFDIKGIILGPLVVACLLGLMNIAEFVLRFEPDSGGAAVRANDGAGVRGDSRAGVRGDGAAGVREGGRAGVREDGGAGIREDGGAGVREDGGAGVREDGGARPG